MPTRPTELRLTITQVPPRASTRSWWRRISSRSPVMLKAYITFLPVRSAWSLITAHHRPRPASSNGQCGPSACSSSSLMKSIPASHSVPTSVGRLLRREADARLDDGADQRPALDAGEPARALDAELRAGIGLGEGRRQAQVEQAQAGELPAARTGCRRPSRRGWAATGRDCRAARTASRAWRARWCSPSLAGGRQRGLGHPRQDLERLDPRGRPCLQLRRLARDRRRRCRSTARRP